MSDDPRDVHDRVEMEQAARHRLAASARWREFAGLREAAGREKLAITLADTTDMSPEQARKVLAAAPLEGE